MSLSAGQVLPGSLWDYSIVKRLHGDDTHPSLVYKAKVVQRDGALDNPQMPQW